MTTFKLELTLQDLVLKEYSLADGAHLTIGRVQGNDIVLKDMTVSRLHATITVKGRTLFVFDQGSKNGTVVNAARVTSAELYDGDIVRIGKNYTIRVSTLTRGGREATLTAEHSPKS
ncbi:MAG: FHA domain-containing protein [Deltaproteobacteria bacterium]|jgi:pSer/pThr/pTyr-binding forkhead associated (FHA) protein